MSTREIVVLTDVALITASVQRGMADEIVEAAQEAGADTLFEYIYRVAEIKRPHGGLMYMHALLTATVWIVIGKKVEFDARHRRNMIIRPIPLRALALALAVFAEASRAEPEPEWSDRGLEARVTAVSDSELRLLPKGAAAGVHVHENLIRIEAESLADGWVVLYQCHENMDAVPAAEVVFNRSCK